MPLKPLKREWRHLRSSIRLWLRYRTTVPTAVYLPGCTHLVEVDPNDSRAQKILIRDGVRGKLPAAAMIWRSLVATVKPTLVVDIGVNFGECLFGITYPTAKHAHGFEANPLIFPVLERTLKHHPDQRMIHLHNVLVSDVSGGSQSFYVDPNWSGTGSAVKTLHQKENIVVHELPVSSLDDCIPAEESQGARLLFKIDIEGYEAKAMKGFAKTLANVELVVGLMEFDTKFLENAGTDPADFLSELLQIFDVYCFPNYRSRKLSRVHGLADIHVRKIHEKSGRRHTDLILIKIGTSAKELLPSDYILS